MKKILTVAALSVALSYGAMAQNVVGGGGDGGAESFHGILIAGMTGPMIIMNNSDQPLLGMIYQRLDTNGVNMVHHDVDYGRILNGKLLNPGESSGGDQGGPISTRGTLRRRVSRMDSAGKITMVSEGDTLGYKILALAFGNGKFYSQATARDVGAWKKDKETHRPALDANGNGVFADDSEVQDTLFQRLSTDISTIRSMAQMLQAQTAEERGLALSRLRLPPAARIPGVSLDLFVEGHRRDMANLLAQLSGEDQIAAINRVAALPDVVRGDR